MTSPNPSFLNEPIKMSNHEVYLMNLGYLCRVYDEMIAKAQKNGVKDELIDTPDGKVPMSSLVMSLIDHKVVQKCFPDGRISSEEIEDMHKEMVKCRIGDGIFSLLAKILQRVEGLKRCGDKQALFEEMDKMMGEKI